MNRERIETMNTIWEFDLDRMVYIRIPKNESPEHPVASAKPYEGHEVAFVGIVLGRTHQGYQEFLVENKGVKFGDGAITASWAIPGHDLTWTKDY